MDKDIADILMKEEDEWSEEEQKMLDAFLAAQDNVILLPPEADAPPVIRRLLVDPFVGHLPAYTLQDIPRPLFFQ